MPILVFGTEKGLLTFYYKKNLKVIPFVGKHSKRVLSGDWSSEGRLVTGAEDSMLTISSANGDTINQSIQLKGPPQLLYWARQKTDERESEVRHVTAMVKAQNICMIDVQQNKISEINFQPAYGQITVEIRIVIG
jgi:WD repeat-containing protein 19